MKAIPAEPEFSVGDEVLYRDLQGRAQRGRIFGIEAKWHSWREDKKPSLTYRISHPSYRNNQAYVSQKDIIPAI